MGACSDGEFAQAPSSLSPPGRGSATVRVMTGKRLAPVARKLRRDMTDAERLLWSRLRGGQLGARFTRQLPIGDAIADFACRSAKLVVELDGGQHAAATETDADRTRRIEAYGYTVVRFWNSDVMGNLDGVCEAIAADLNIARDS